MDTTLSDPLIGRLIDGRYRVDQRIAVGGMATVYQATDTRLDRELALKVMHPSLAEDPAFVERFIREAKSVARLTHPNVVGVLDQGTDGDCVYLAMEYVPGCTLRDVLRDRGALTPRAALGVLEPLLAGLAAAHRAGLVHRDIKPENVLIGDDGRVKVADFGLVHGVGTQTSATTGSLLGTVSYLAPEQIDGGEVDARTDVFACGVLLYEMLTGARPQAGDTPAQVMYARVNEDVPLPSLVAEHLAPELDGLVARATAREPERRPASAAALLSSVRAVRAALTDEQLDAGPPAAEAASAAAGTAGGPGGSEEPTRVVPPLAAAAPEPTTRLTAGAPPEPVAAPGSGQLLVGMGRDDGSAFDDESGYVPPRRRLSRRGKVSLIVGALLLLLGGAGVWYINAGQFQRTPGVYGLPSAEAEETLRDAGLRVRFEEAFSETVEPGHVITTDPERGERVRRNTTVTVTVSLGPEMAEVPDVEGLPLAEAQERLREAGLTPGEEIREFSAQVPRGAVVRTDPAAGEQRRPNSAVDLVVSRGRQIRVPDVVGLPEGEAMQQLREAGLAVEVAAERVYSEEDAGTVARQSPGAGRSAGEGDTVTLTISRGPEMVRVPDVVGEDQDRAVEILEDAGFEVNVNRIFLTGTVFSQSVDGGDRAPRGSTITIWVR